MDKLEWLRLQVAEFYISGNADFQRLWLLEELFLILKKNKDTWCKALGYLDTELDSAQRVFKGQCYG